MASGDKLYWKADDNSTGQLLVVALEDVEDKISEFWHRQDCPSGIYSLHRFICKSMLGISRPQVSEFVKKQVAWQMIAPKRNKSKFRKTVLAKRPFVFCEYDIADMIYHRCRAQYQQHDCCRSVTWWRE